MRTEFFSTIGFPLLKQSLEKFRSDNPTHTIDVCGVLINNTRTSGSNLGPHHQDALSDIYDEANDYGWPIMENQMFHSDGYPKLMKEEYPGYIGNAAHESQQIAKEFIEMVSLSL